ncbi:hypothetical protein [Actinacidiphila glaucinigra]|uniref:hypothetical protein n=1 Tax=Actinacidiphila glaucinigra TaxID=235986 RepID=UPI00366CE981
MMSMLAEGPSETFWSALSAVGTVAAVIVAVAAIYFAYRATVPRRRVRWSARVSSLMSHGAAHTHGLDVTWLGHSLSHPHIVEVELSNVGNKDLDVDGFNGRPIEILSDKPVVALLKQTSVPAVQRVLNATAHADRVELDTTTPFHRGQTLRYVLLVDGQEPYIDLRTSISNCTPERHSPPSLQPAFMREFLASGVAGASAAGIGAIVIAVKSIFS